MDFHKNLDAKQKIASRSHKLKLCSVFTILYFEAPANKWPQEATIWAFLGRQWDWLMCLACFLCQSLNPLANVIARTGRPHSQMAKCLKAYA